MREQGFDAPGAFDAIDVRHGDIHQHHMGRGFTESFNGFIAVQKTLQSPVAGPILENLPHGNMDGLVVIHQGHPDFWEERMIRSRQAPGWGRFFRGTGPVQRRENGTGLDRCSHFILNLPGVEHVRQRCGPILFFYCLRYR